MAEVDLNPEIRRWLTVEMDFEYDKDMDLYVHKEFPVVKVSLHAVEAVEKNFGMMMLNEMKAAVVQSVNEARLNPSA